MNLHTNKKQLIEIIVKALVDETIISEDGNWKIIVTGQTPTPIEMSAGGLVIHRRDLDNIHEEADEIVVAQAMYTSKVENKEILHGQTFLLILHTFTLTDTYSYT